MTVIDLGELRDDVAPDPPARPPRAVGRPYRCLVVLLAALVTLAGAAPAPRRVVVTVPGVSAFVLDDRMYVTEAPEPGRGVGRQLVAYRATAGQLRTLWRFPLPGDDVVLTGWAVDGWLLLSARGTNTAGWETLALDAATGRLGWRRPGVSFSAGGVPLVYTGEDAEAVSRVDVGTGRTLWSVSTTSAEPGLSLGPAGADRLVLTHDSGTVEVFDVASGARLAARDLRLGEPSGRRTVVVAGLLVIQGADDTVTGYDLDKLDRRWTASLARADYFDGCGRSLCVSGQKGGFGVLDPATGALRWTDPRWSSSLTAADGRLLVARPAATASALAVVEEDTGRLVADLGEWQVVPWNGPDSPVLGLRPGGNDRLIIAELDLAAGHARIRDALPDAIGDCHSNGALLVCHRIDGRLALWWNR